MIFLNKQEYFIEILSAFVLVFVTGVSLAKYNTNNITIIEHSIIIGIINSLIISINIKYLEYFVNPNILFINYLFSNVKLKKMVKLLIYQIIGMGLALIFLIIFKNSFTNNNIELSKLAYNPSNNIINNSINEFLLSFIYSLIYYGIYIDKKSNQIYLKYTILLFFVCSTIVSKGSNIGCVNPLTYLPSIFINFNIINIISYLLSTLIGSLFGYTLYKNVLLYDQPLESCNN